MSDYFQLMSADGDRTVTHVKPFKLSVNYCRTNTRKKLFSERVVKVWNSLPLSIVTFSSLAHTHTHIHTHTRLTALFRDYPGEPVPERQNQSGFYYARDSEWQCHPLGHMQVCTSLQTDNHTSTPPLSFYRPDALPAAQPTVLKH